LILYEHERIALIHVNAGNKRQGADFVSGRRQRHLMGGALVRRREIEQRNANR
jgi:hypothetical protein